MAVQFKSPDYYRAEAQRLRVKAKMTGSEAHEVLCELARDYELLAESVRTIEKSRKTLSQHS